MSSAGRDRGATEVLGLVVLAPVVIGLALVVVWVGRSVHVDARLRTAAEAAAQAGALTRSQVDAQRAASDVVEVLLAGDPECSSVWAEVPVDADRRVGMPYGMIEVTVVCAVDHRVLPSRPEIRTATAWATVDRFRVGVAP